MLLGLLFTLADVPENLLSLHRAISHLSDKRLRGSSTCASLRLMCQRTVRRAAGGGEECEPIACRTMEHKIS